MPEHYARFPEFKKSFFSDPLATTTHFSVVLFQIFYFDLPCLKREQSEAAANRDSVREETRREVNAPDPTENSSEQIDTAANGSSSRPSVE